METAEGNIETKPDILFNTARICRFCLSPAGVLSPIFEQGEVNSLPLSSKIMAFVSIQVSKKIQFLIKKKIIWKKG